MISEQQIAGARLRNDCVLLRHIKINKASSLLVDVSGVFGGVSGLPYRIGTWVFCRVLSVGPGYTRPNGVLVRTELRPGDIIVVEKRILYRPLWSLAKPGGDFGIYLIRERDILATFEPDDDAVVIEREEDDEHIKMAP